MVRSPKAWASATLASRIRVCVTRHEIEGRKGSDFFLGIADLWIKEMMTPFTGSPFKQEKGVHTVLHRRALLKP